MSWVTNIMITTVPGDPGIKEVQSVEHLNKLKGEQNIEK